MSIEAYCWAQQQRTGHPYMKFVLLVLGDHADQDCMAGVDIADIAWRTEIPPDKVEAAIQRLSKAGFVEILPSGLRVIVPKERML